MENNDIEAKKPEFVVDVKGAGRLCLTDIYRQVNIAKIRNLCYTARACRKACPYSERLCCNGRWGLQAAFGNIMKIKH